MRQRRFYVTLLLFSVPSTSHSFVLRFPTLPKSQSKLPLQPQANQRRRITCLDSKSSSDGEDDERERMLEFLEALDRRKSDELLEYSIDSFLRGDYVVLAEDAPAPFPGLSPTQTVDVALRALRDLDEPEASHGAAVLLRFCLPLRKGERWSGVAGDATGAAWKNLLRGSLTPTMLARRLRSSDDFAPLLDWDKLVVEDEKTTEEKVTSDIAFVTTKLFFNDLSGDLKQLETFCFQVRRFNGVWMIETATKPIHKEALEVQEDSSSSTP